MSPEVGFPATASVGLVELADIRFLRAAWPRVELDGDRAAEFYALYEAEGETALPPVEVISDPDGGFVLVDGWHLVVQMLMESFQAFT